MTAAYVRTAAMLVALVAQATAAVAAGECAAPAQRSYFASGGFYRGDGAEDLVGNAFVVLASAGPLCGEPGASAECTPQDNRRTWLTQMVTAAHVVTELCDARPEKAVNWSPGRLVLYPGYQLETRNAVELTLDASWCATNRAAGLRLSGTPVALDSHTAGPEAIDREHVDLWMFSATFLLPRRALISPYTLSLLPREPAADIKVLGFSPFDAGGFATAPLGGRPVVFGSVAATPAGFDLAKSRYQMDALVFHGQSGSPVGFFPPGGPQSVFGVLVETGATTCAKITDDERQRLAKQLAAAGLAADGDDGDDNLRHACLEEESARKKLSSRDRTAYFVPIVRNPRFISEAYDRQVAEGGIPDVLRTRLDARVDAALSLYQEPASQHGKDFLDALRLIMQGLTTIQQIVVIEKIKARATPPLTLDAALLLDTTMCDHLEPQVADDTGVR